METNSSALLLRKCREENRRELTRGNSCSKRPSLNKAKTSWFRAGESSQAAPLSRRRCGWFNYNDLPLSFLRDKKGRQDFSEPVVSSPCLTHSTPTGPRCDNRAFLRPETPRHFEKLIWYHAETRHAIIVADSYCWDKRQNDKSFLLRV